MNNDKNKGKSLEVGKDYELLKKPKDGIRQIRISLAKLAAKAYNVEEADDIQRFDVLKALGDMQGVTFARGQIQPPLVSVTAVESQEDGTGSYLTITLHREEEERRANQLQDRLYHILCGE